MKKQVKIATKPVLEVKQLTKVYGPGFSLPWKPKKDSFTAVNGISFTLHEGEILGLLGPNGAGKTTTIQMLLSTLSRTSGNILYFGKELDQHRSEILQNVSFASTYIRLPSRLTVYENLEVYGRLFGLRANERKFRIKKFLSFFGAWELRDCLTSTLSAGQTTRVMLAKSFLAHPKIALLDEPTASLDPDISREVLEFVLLQRKEYGVSILFTSHNMDEVSEVCDRVLFLQHGRILANDTPQNLARSISTTYVDLVVEKGTRILAQYCREHDLPITVDEKLTRISIDEHRIAKFLHELALQGVTYTHITITTPTLNDYFIHVARQGNTKRTLEESL